MAFTHLRAGEFMPAYFRQVPNIAAKGAMFLPMEDARIASIDVGDIAEIAAHVLTSAGHEGKTYPLTGPEALTMTQIAEKLSAAIGKTVRYVNVPPEDARQAQLAAGMPRYGRCLVRIVRRATQWQGGKGMARRRSIAWAAANLI